MEIAKLDLSSRETQIFDAYTDLLSKFEDMACRFNLSRIHKHFDMESDEVLHEKIGKEKTNIKC